VTDDFAELRAAGHRSAAQLFGVFDVSILLNLIHIVLGIAGLWLARTWAGARIYLIGGGAICLALWIYGLAVGRDSSANFIPVDSADNWLHFAVGLAMLAAGIVLGRQVPHQKEAASAT
jgi:4-hydroxybenzoate polyprenyltransferase